MPNPKGTSGAAAGKHTAASCFSFEMSKQQNGKTLKIELGRSFAVLVIFVAAIMKGGAVAPATTTWIKTLIGLLR